VQPQDRVVWTNYLSATADSCVGIWGALFACFGALNNTLLDTQHFLRVTLPYGWSTISAFHLHLHLCPNLIDPILLVNHARYDPIVSRIESDGTRQHPSKQDVERLRISGTRPRRRRDIGDCFFGVTRSRKHTQIPHEVRS
jgi:hypothetical protein